MSDRPWLEDGDPALRVERSLLKRLNAQQPPPGSADHGWATLAAEIAGLEALGGAGAHTDDEAENAWLAQIAAQSLTNEKSSHQLAWLGLGDHAQEGQFGWVTGAPLTLAFWFSGEPNSLNKAEDCGEMRASGLWNDDRCNAELAYVCECDGLPNAGEWCDTDDNATCGNCTTACASDQTCTSQLCK